MSERDVQRIRVLSEVLSGQRTVGSAAAVLEVTPRQARRLLGRLRAGGSVRSGTGCVDALPTIGLGLEIQSYAMDLVRERYADFGPSLAAEKLAELHDVKVSAETFASGWSPLGSGCRASGGGRFISRVCGDASPLAS